MQRYYKQILLILFIAPALTWSQQLLIDNDFMAMAYVSLGNHHVDFNELETVMQSSSLSYPALPTSMFTFGAGGVFTIKDWVLAGEGVGLFSSTEAFDQYNGKLSGGYVTLDTGFLIKRSKTVLIYPLIGIGGASISYKVYQEPATLSFKDALENPSYQVTLNNKSMFFHLAMAAQYHIHFNSVNQDGGNFIIGLRAGYKATLKSLDWYIQGTDTKLTQGPVAGIDGYYVQIMFGISGENLITVD